MALTKQTTTDKIESVRIKDYFVLQVRETVEVLENDEIISQNFHRYVLNPDADVSTISDDVVNAQFNTVMTDQVKANYQTFLASQTEENE